MTLFPPISQGVSAFANLNALPLLPLGRVLVSIVSVLKSNHPGFFERMEGYCETRFLIDPIDIPLVFLFRPDPDNPAIDPFWSTRHPNWDVRVAGRLRDLVDLFEGRVDGDALFFSRAISIEGDTSAVLALRNAVDSEEINLTSEISARFGPFAAPLNAVGSRAPELVGKAFDLVERVRSRIAEPVVARSAQSNQKPRDEVNRLKANIDMFKNTEREQALSGK